MLLLLSPAKTLDESRNFPEQDHTDTPSLLAHSAELIMILRELSPTAIQDLMSVSPKIALLNAERFDEFELPLNVQKFKNHSKAKAAAFLFKGDVYQGLDASNLSTQGLAYLSKNVGILSGLYGYLKALDVILPYRLEMGTVLKNPRGKDLYAFWKPYITAHINTIIQDHYHNCVINLASQEYFSAVDVLQLRAPIITPIFKDQKSGQTNSPHKIISFYAKRARGLMARFACEQQITDPEDLKSFDLDGYYFKEVVFKNNVKKDPLNAEQQWIFQRDA